MFQKIKTREIAGTSIMGKKERQLARMLGQNNQESDAPAVQYFQGDFFKLPWYFEGWWQKLIVIASFFALLWTIFSLAFLGLPCR
jgi:hypothetical protein